MSGQSDPETRIRCSTSPDPKSSGLVTGGSRGPGPLKWQALPPAAPPYLGYRTSPGKLENASKWRVKVRRSGAGACGIGACRQRVPIGDAIHRVRPMPEFRDGSTS